MKKQLLILGLALITLTNLNAQRVFVDEDFDGGTLPTNWTNTAITGTDTWQFGNTVNLTEDENWSDGTMNIDSSNMAYFDDDRVGQFVTNNTVALETPSFDNSLSVSTTLRFDYNFREIGGVSDSFYVEVFDGAVWQTVFSVDVDDCGRYDDDCKAGFPFAVVDISTYANAVCQVRFVYHDGNDWGWHAGIDNVLITAPLDNDIQLAEIVSPIPDDCGLDSMENVIVKIVNRGSVLATNFDVTADIDDGDQILTETVTDSIIAGDSMEYTFIGGVDLFRLGAYKVKSYVNWDQDQAATNDTLVVDVTNSPAFTLPFTDLFEVLQDSSPWTTYGSNNSWGLNFPNSRIISSASQGNFAWVTNPDTAYNDFELSYIESPCFDLSASIGDPYVSFDIWYATAGFTDSVIMEMSVDNGETWTLVEEIAISENWYNEPRRNSTIWAGNSGGWKRAESILPGAAGKSRVKVRFQFSSDSGNFPWDVQDGVGIDRFALRESRDIDLAAKTLVFPDPRDLAPECGYGQENMQLEIHNRGFEDVDSFLIGFQIGNGPINREKVIRTIPAFTRIIETYQTPADLSANGTVNINLWVEVLGDGLNTNDSLTNQAVTNVVQNSLNSPFRINFNNSGFAAGTNAGNTNSQIPSNWLRPEGTFTFNVANSGVNLPNPRGPGTDHTGNNGNFIYTEPTTGTFGDVAFLETPCLNFATKSALTLEFWYHGNGTIGANGVMIDVFDGAQWIEEVDVITSFPQTSRVSPWSFYSLPLNQFVGKNIKVRWRVDHSGPSTMFAMDDLVIYEPLKNDAEVISIDGPISDCSVNSSSLIDVTLRNFGSDSIMPNTLNVTYQVIGAFNLQTFLFDTATVTELYPSAIAPREVVNYTFNTTADLSVPSQRYTIHAWTSLFGDSNTGNDSIRNYGTQNFSLSPGFRETFESALYVDGSCLNPANDIVSKGWTVNNGQFSWNLQDARVCKSGNGATPTFGTGPSGDHTDIDGAGQFFYTESTLGVINDEAELLSPCIDFRESTGAAMAFWYHRFGAGIGDLYIDVLADGVWTNGVDQIVGQTQFTGEDEWLLKSVNLGLYAGKLIQVRFRGVLGSGTGDIAIDDIEIFSPIPQDARVSQVLTPVTACDPDGLVSVTVENFGTDTIFAGDVAVKYSINGLPPIVDTLDTTIGPGAVVVHIFDQLGIFTRPNSEFNMVSWTELQNDSNIFNDSARYRFNNITQTLDYQENFESFTDGGCQSGPGADGLRRAWFGTGNGTSYRWEVETASVCAGNGGPIIDATRGGGKFMLASVAGGGNSAYLHLPCIDFRGQTTAGIFFSYHTFANVNGGIAVEVFNDNNGLWTEIQRITGSPQLSESDPWEKVFVKMDQFGDRLLQIRFRAIKTGLTADLSIDDVGFYLPAGQDAEILEILGPLSGCELFDSSKVQIRFRNFGTESIKKGDLDVYYQIDDQTPIRETYDDSLIVDEVVTYEFSTPADLNDQGKTYNIKAWTALKDEENFTNDSILKYEIENTSKGIGYIESFETFRDAMPQTAFGQVMDNGWTVTSGLTGYTWHVQTSTSRFNAVATPTSFTGPENDRTTGKGNFMYVDAGDNNFNPNPFAENQLEGTATLVSPCINLVNDTAARMSFWYHRFGARVGIMYIDVFEDGVWNNGIWEIQNQSQTSSRALWKQATVPLDSFLGKQILLRFRAEDKAALTGQSGIFGDMAIDDIVFYQPSSKDLGIISFPSPGLVDACNIAGDRPVTVGLENRGIEQIDSGEVILSYRYGGIQVFDTLAQNIAVGEKINFTFDKMLDLSTFNGTSILRVSAQFNGDTILGNNSIFVEVNNRQPGLPRYFMDFENHSPADIQGWKSSITSSPNMPGSIYRWHVQCGPGPWVNGMIPVPPPGPPSGPSGDRTFMNTVENGAGCYMLTESNWPNPPIKIPDALLELPCGELDFSNSVNNELLLTFWYHMFTGSGGNMGDVFVDVHNGVEWRNRVDVIRGDLVGNDFTEDTDRWREKQVSLDQFAGLSKVRVRLRAEFKGRSGEIGVDNIEILDRIKKDGKMVRIKDPDSDCNLTNSERFRVEFQNLGTEDILESRLCYQITFTPLTSDSGFKVEPQVKDVVCDTAVGLGGFVAPMARQEFEFDRIDMSEPGTYEFKIWTNIEGDTYHFNDTVEITRQNLTRPFPYCEDFSDMTLGDIPQIYFDGTMPNGWDGNETGYMWQAGTNGASLAGAGHTDLDRPQNDPQNRNDLYLYAPDPGIPQLRAAQARIESPCYDLTDASAAVLNFWYKAPSAFHLIFIDVNRGGQGWQRIDTIGNVLGADFGKFAWTEEEISLTDFIGDFVQVRFIALNDGMWVAIDDFCIESPPPQQIQLERILNPLPGLCYYGPHEAISFQVNNVGNDRIEEFDVILAFDAGFQNFPVGQDFRDTIKYKVNGPPFFDPGDEFTVTLDPADISGLDSSFLLDLSQPGRSYFLSVFLDLPGDINLVNNKVEDYTVFHPIPLEITYVEDFELIKGQGIQGQYTNGISNFGGFYFWREWTGPLAPQYIPLTGPLVDHTKGTSEGSFMMTIADLLNVGDAAAFQTRCLDLRTAIDPQLKYWYHMFGTQMGNLIVQVNDDTGWRGVDTIQGIQQFSNFDDWKSSQVSLKEYAGTTVRLRFVSIRGGVESNMGVDDITVFDLEAKDLAVDGLKTPNTDTTSCYSENQKVEINLRNNGSEDLDFSMDSVFVRVTIFKGPDSVATLVDTITDNIFIPGGGSPPTPTVPLPRDSIGSYELTPTFDMTDFGSVYRFIIEAILPGDSINRNDELATTVLSQIVAGEAHVAIPDTICSGDQVRIKARNYFGGHRWEEKRAEPDGSDFWLPGINFPFDQRTYFALPDTTTEYRIRLCNSSVVSDSFRVEVIKPYPPIGIDDAVCGLLESGRTTRPPQLEMITASNIDQYRMYDSLTGGSVLITRKNTSSLNDTTRIAAPFLPPITRTDTFFIESIIESDAPGIVNGFCTSLERDSVIVNLNSIPDPRIIKFDTLFECDPDSFKGNTSCYTLNNPKADTVLSVCQDSAFRLDAGRVAGRQDFYEWIAIHPDGSVVTGQDSALLRSQTLVIDAWRLQPNQTYGYAVIVTSLQGCSNVDTLETDPNFPDIPPDTVWVEITDSCITGISEVAFKQGFNIYPNPVNDELFIVHKSLESFKGNVQLMSIEGQLIHKDVNLNFGNLNHRIDMGTLPKGMYIIRVESERGSFVEKIIKS